MERTSAGTKRKVKKMRSASVAEEPVSIGVDPEQVVMEVDQQTDPVGTDPEPRQDPTGTLPAQAQVTTQESLLNQIMATLRAIKDQNQRITEFETRGLGCEPRQPTPFTGIGKSAKVRNFLNEIEMYFDALRARDDEKVKVAATFLKGHALRWWRAYRKEHPIEADVMDWETWQDMLLNRFTSKYQDLCDGVDLVRFRQTGSLLDYVREFTFKMEALSHMHMDEFSKKVIFLSGLKPEAERELYKQPTLPDTCAKLLKKTEGWLGMEDSATLAQKTQKPQKKRKGGFKRSWSGAKR